MLQPIKFIDTEQPCSTRVMAVNACPTIDGLTRPILPSGVPKGEDSKLCAADGWIDEGREHVTGTLSKLSG